MKDSDSGLRDERCGSSGGSKEEAVSGEEEAINGK